MANLTSDGAFELVLLFGYAFGAFALATSLVSPTVKQLGGPQYRGIALVPGLFGVGLILFLLVVFGEETLSIFPTVERLSRLWTVLAAAGAVFVAVAVGTVLLLHVPQIVGSVPASRRLLGRGGPPAAEAIALAVSMVVIFGVAWNLAPGEVLRGSSGRSETRLALRQRFHLAAPPLAMALRDSRSGYLALEDDGIHFFELPDGNGELRMRKVADVILPHGMLVRDGVLYVTSLGPFPCQDLAQGCSVTAESFPRTDSTIVAFDIEPDGTLGPGRVVLGDLPSASTWHAVNGVAEGPDGYLYTAIGNLRAEQTEGLDASATNRRLLGTVIRYRPEDPEAQIFATGIRNIFDLEFDDEGGLWGADNDGPTLRGFKVEEALHITEGADFGYPRVGTYDAQRTTPPVSALPETRGSAGLEWAPRIGMEPGLLIGSERKLEYLPVTRDQAGYYVTGSDATHPTELLLEATNGFVTIVEAGPDGRLWVGTYGFRLDSELAIFEVEP